MDSNASNLPYVPPLQTLKTEEPVFRSKRDEVNPTAKMYRQ